MSLSELMVALRESKVIDQTMTVTKVVTFFVIVNADDELRAGRNPGAGAAELDYDEFVEIVCRICNEKVSQDRQVPFEETLNTWLGLQFLPALRNAGKGLLAS